MEDKPTRKPYRLREFDYSSPGAYFITICTKNKEHLFWSKNVGASIARPQKPELSPWGRVVEEAICEIPARYPAISLDNYAVMPNHIHLLLRISADAGGRAMLAPTVSTVVQQMKGAVSKKLGCSVWQKLFNDHVIRSQRDYDEIWNYIEYNPLKWENDCYYE